MSALASFAGRIFMDREAGGGVVRTAAQTGLNFLTYNVAGKGLGMLTSMMSPKKLTESAKTMMALTAGIKQLTKSLGLPEEEEEDGT